MDGYTSFQPKNWILVFLISVLTNGTNGEGYSAHTTKAFDIQSSSSTKPFTSVLNNFKVEQEYGFYSQSLYNNKQLEISTQGIYLIFVNLILHNTNEKQEVFTELKIHEKYGQSQIFCRTFKTIWSTVTLSINCFVRLKQRNVVDISVKTSEVLQVLAGSTLSLQYIGDVGMIPSFIQPLEGNDEDIQKKKPLDYQYYNTLFDFTDITSIPIQCNGIYAVSLTATISPIIKNKSTSFQLILNTSTNSTVLYKDIFTDNNSYFTINTFHIVNLQQNDTIIIEYNNLQFLDISVYSIVQLYTNIDSASGFIIPLSMNEVEIKNGNNNDEKMLSFDILDDMLSEPPNFVSNEKVDDLWFIERDDLYIISVNMELKSSILTENIYNNTSLVDNLQLVVSTNDFDEENIHILNGIAYIQNIDINNIDHTKNKTTKKLNDFNKTLSVSGILRLRHNTKLDIKAKINKQLQVNMKNVRFSVISIPRQSYGISAVVEGDAVNCKNQWIPIKDFQSNYGPSQFVNSGQIIIPTTGVYIVYAVLNIRTIDNEMQFVKISINNTNTNTSIVNNYSIKKLSNKLLTVTVGGVAEFHQNDELKLFLNCENSIKIDGKVEFTVLYITNLQSSHYLITTSSEKNARLIAIKDVKTFNQKSIQISHPGVYLVSYSVTLRYKNLKTQSILKLLIYRKGWVGDERNYGLIKELVLPIADDTTDMIKHGVTTIEIIGYLKFKKGDILKVDLEWNNLVEIDVDFLSEGFSYILMTHSLTNTLGFKTVQTTSKLFNFRNRLHLLDNFIFSDKTGGYILKTTSFFGPYFVASKPVTVLYIIKLHLASVIGKFKLYIRIRPQNILTEISQLQNIIEQSDIVLSANGVLQLSTDESVEFLIFGEKISTIVLCKRSMISLMEVAGHQSALSAYNAQQNLEFQEGTYAIKSAMGLQFVDGNLAKNGEQLMSMQNALTPIDNHFLSNSKLITMPCSNRITLNFNTTGTINTCTVTIISIPPNCNLNIEGINILNSNISPLSTTVILCLHGNETLSLKNSVIKSDKKAQNITIVPINKKSKTEGFSTMLISEYHVNTTDIKRVDRWLWSEMASSESLLFWNTNGFADGYGSFVAQQNGFYVISLVLFVKKNENRCTFSLMNDDNEIINRTFTKQTESYQSIHWLKQQSILQVFVSCNNASITLMKQSRWSVLLTDSQPSFDSFCKSSLETLTLDVQNETLNLAARSDLNLTCNFQSNYISDFHWVKNDEVLQTTVGKRFSFLHLQSVMFQDNGIYSCEAKRGSSIYKTKTVNVKVYEPRPELTLLNDTVFIEENFITNDLVTWVIVKAVSIHHREKNTDVKLQIIDGDDENMFYFSPQITKHLSALRFNKPFNYEHKRLYKLLIQAQNLEDSTAKSLIQKNITIKILNRNEHKPKFTEADKECSIIENSSIDTYICNVTAIDEDMHSNITYELYYASVKDTISVNNTTGDIYVKRLIDREVSDIINIMMTATDGVYTAFQYVKLKVLDINDNRPEFITDVFQFSIRKDEVKPFSPLCRVNATDQDYADNAVLHYSILEQNKTRFLTINQKTGEIFWNFKETLPNVNIYKFQIEARDFGQPSLTKTCKVILTVYNDNVTIPVTVLPVTQSLNDAIHDNVSDWRYWLIGGVIMFILTLIAILICMWYRNKRSEKEITELLTRSSSGEDALQSVVLYKMKPSESVEATLYISSETLPSAYHSYSSLTTSFPSTNQKKEKHKSSTASLINGGQRKVSTSSMTNGHAPLLKDKDTLL